MSGWVCVPVATGCTIITQVCMIERTVGMIMIWVGSIEPMFCGQALLTESSSRREGGSGTLGTFHSPVSLGNFPLTLLLPYHLTTLPPYHLTTLPPYHLTTLPPDHQEEKCQWKKRSVRFVSPPHVLAGDSALLCLIYIIILLYMIVAYYIIISVLCFDLSLSGCNVRAFLSSNSQNIIFVSMYLSLC